MASRSKSRSKSRGRGDGDDSRRRSTRLSASKNMYKTPPPNNNRRRLSSKRKRASSNGFGEYNNNNNNNASRERHDLSAVTNEYELLIRAIKELEFLLDTNIDQNDEEGNDDNDIINPEEQFVIPKGMYAKLHQFQMNGKKLPKKIIKKILFINTLRNKLVHNYYTTSLEVSEINVVKDVYAEVYKSLQDIIKKS